MDLRASAEKLLNTQNPGVLLSLCLLPLSLASFIFGIIVLIRSSLYKIGIFKSYKAGCKVITIGNLTVGGTGKTPTVCLVAKHFKESGLSTAVICRGYRGTKTDTPMVVSDKEKVLMDSVSAGDEAYMLARKLSGIPVLAGKNRVSASKMACDLFNCEIIILDDGFQHLKLKRDIDVVLINTQNPFGNGFLLPRGILREPLKALKRADMILFTKKDQSETGSKELENTIRRHNHNAPIYKSFYKPISLKTTANNNVNPDLLKNKNISCFCSIGDPESFFSMLKNMGLALTDKIIFPDHHHYKITDYNKLKEISKKTDFLITTEKDIVKINPDMLKITNLAILEIDEVIDNTEEFLKLLSDKERD
jgi:tetraacyldisaccharide 4'-kinase